MAQSVIIIGSGFSSLAASCYMAKLGYEVTVLEKNDTIGGRAAIFKKDDFTFDMGPTWYWMPDVFERFFADFNKKPSDYYEIKKLSPAYKVYFGKNDAITIPDNLEAIYEIFEQEEPGSAKHLKKFIASAKFNYDLAIKDLVYRPGVSITELITPATIKRIGQFFTTIDKQIRKNIQSPKLRKILEFPVLFLGAKPSDTPTFYNFMNYADFGLGTWHPMGGMHEVAKGMAMLAKELGVVIKTNEPANKIDITNSEVKNIMTNKGSYAADIVISGADYHHTETLFPKQYKGYSEKYWKSRTFAPSSLLFYVGFSAPLKNVEHHTLFFDTDFEKHAKEIYDHPQWPENPLFYASFPGKTDASLIPKGKEAGTFLIPLAPGIEDTPELREQYFKIIIKRLETLTNQKVTDKILFKKSFCVNDFIEKYNSYKGNAYGLANILLQTAFLRPKLKSKKVKNLYFTGQLTVPGPGVPPALISGKIVTELIKKNR